MERPTMDDAADRMLEDELGAPAPDGLRTLTDEELSSLADVVHDAKLRQSEALEAGIDESLGHLPRLLRGPIRKTLFG